MRLIFGSLDGARTHGAGTGTSGRELRAGTRESAAQRRNGCGKGGYVVGKIGGGQRQDPTEVFAAGEVNVLGGGHAAVSAEGSRDGSPPAGESYGQHGDGVRHVEGVGLKELPITCQVLPGVGLRRAAPAGGQQRRDPQIGAWSGTKDSGAWSAESDAAGQPKMGRRQIVPNRDNKA